MTCHIRAAVRSTGDSESEEMGPEKENGYFKALTNKTVSQKPSFVSFHRSLYVDLTVPKLISISQVLGLKCAPHQELLLFLLLTLIQGFRRLSTNGASEIAQWAKALANQA